MDELFYMFPHKRAQQEKARGLHKQKQACEGFQQRKGGA